MNKIVAVVFLLVLSIGLSAQETKKDDSLLFARALATARTGGDWKETEWGVLYYKALDSLEKEYTGRLDGEVFKQKKAVLDRNWYVSRLKAAEQSYKDEQFRQFTKNALRSLGSYTYVLDSLRTIQDAQMMRIDSLHHELAVNRTANRIELHQEYQAAKDSLDVRLKKEGWL